MRVADLEERVEEKTRDLALVNDRLRAKIEGSRARRAARKGRRARVVERRTSAPSRSLSRRTARIGLPLEHEPRDRADDGDPRHADLLCEPDRREIAQHVRTIQRNRDHLLARQRHPDLSKIEAGAMTFERPPCSPGKILPGGRHDGHVVRGGEGLASFGARTDPGDDRHGPTRLRRSVEPRGHAISSPSAAAHIHACPVPPADGRAPGCVRRDGHRSACAPTVMESLFRPLRRRIRLRPGGSGIGARPLDPLRLAQLMGGSITVQSRERGRQHVHAAGRRWRARRRPQIDDAGRRGHAVRGQRLVEQLGRVPGRSSSPRTAARTSAPSSSTPCSRLRRDRRGRRRRRSRRRPPRCAPARRTT